MSTTETDSPSLGFELSADQLRAVEHHTGPLAVLAGPGSGKTRVIVSRVARLALQPSQGGSGADPATILALAFTNKSAREMQERLASLLSQSVANNLRVGTCHSFGRRTLARFGDAIGLPANLRVMDSACQRRILRKLAIEYKLFRSTRAQGIETSLEHTAKFIAECQNAAIEPSRALAYAQHQLEQLENGEIEGDEKALAAQREKLPLLLDRARLFQLYDQHRIPLGRITLDDYIDLPVRILRTSETAAAIMRDEARHIVVDEFQDWNPVQIELLRLLAPETTGKPRPDVCVVGDDDQAIYAFRGADDRAFARFHTYWPSADVIRLATNYRSAAPIVNAAKFIIEGVSSRFDPQKTIEANDNWSGDGPSSVEGVIVTDNAHIGPTIGAMILAERTEHDRPWSSFAVLTRTGNVQDEMVTALEALGIPVTATRKPTPLDDPAVQDLISWMRLLAEDNPGAHAQRLLTRPLSSATYQQVSQWRKQWQRDAGIGENPHLTFLDWIETQASNAEPIARFIRTRDELSKRVHGTGAADAAMHIIQGAALVQADGLIGPDRAPRIANLAAVCAFIRECEPDLDPPRGLREFVEYYDDLTDDKEKAFKRSGDNTIDGDDPEDDNTNAVTVITAHSAKGLEFDTVFVARCRPSGFPEKKKAAEDPLVPHELSGREARSQSDEERRLFYVACTRAERRLVLLAKEKKSRGKTTDYFIELQDELGTGFHTTDADHWLSRAGVTLPEGLSEDAQALASRLDAMVADARQDAARALDDAQQPAINTEEMSAIQSKLRDAAERLAMIAHLKETGTMHPKLAGTNPSRAEQIKQRASQSQAPTPKTLTAPLKLSYSMINDYQRCPACFYVKRILGFDTGSSSALTLGSAVHEALEKFYIKVRSAEADGKPVPGLPLLKSLAEQVLRRDWPEATPVEPDAFQKVEGQLELFWEKLHDPAAEILLLEGKGHTGESIKPFTYTYRGDHTFTAKVDRVDRLPDGGFRIIDYKTGNPWKPLITPEKDDLQLCIYTIALQEHLGLEEPPAGSAEYWIVSTGQRGVIALQDLKLEKARADINKAIDGILDGLYPRGQERKCSKLCEVLGIE